MNEISLSFDDKVIFNNLNYEFHNNIYLLQGESGVGKTTLLNMICGYIEPTNGSIEKCSEKRINYLFQDHMLFHNLTVKENIYIKIIALNLDDEIVKKKTMEASMKFGIENMLDKLVGTLSGGERQRVQLAILSLNDCDIILLDEPIANLDRKNSKMIMDYILEIKDKLIIIVSHQYIKTSNEYILLELKEGKIYEV